MGGIRRGLRGTRHDTGEGREGARQCRAVSILYQYEIQTDGVGAKGTEQGPCGSVLALPSVAKETERALETLAMRQDAGKTRKVAAPSRSLVSDVKRQGNLRSTTAAVHLIGRDFYAAGVTLVDCYSSICSAPPLAHTRARAWPLCRQKSVAERFYEYP